MWCGLGVLPSKEPRSAWGSSGPSLATGSRKMILRPQHNTWNSLMSLVLLP